MEKEVQPDLNKTYKLALQFCLKRKRSFESVCSPLSDTVCMAVFLTDTFKEKNLVDIKQLLIEARAIKTPWEIEVLREAAHYSELTMNKSSKRHCSAGMTEADVLQLFNTTAFSWSPDIIDVANAHTIGENFTPSFIPPHTRINRGYYSSGWRSDLKVTIPIWPEHLWLEQQRRRTEKKLHAHIFWDGYEYAINNIGPGVKNEQKFSMAYTSSVKGERLQWLVCERPSGVIPSDAHCSVKNIQFIAA